MKHLFYIFLFAFISQYTYSQDNTLISSDSTIRNINNDYHIVNIKKDILLDNDEFDIQFNNVKFKAKKTHFFDRGINGYGLWAEDASDRNNILYLSIISNRISGFINVNKDKYTINTSANGQYIISKTIDTIELNNANDVIYIDSNNNKLLSQTATNSTDTYKAIRMLVLHTPSAGSPTEILEEALGAIDNTNIALENSVNDASLKAKVELVYVGETNYSGSSTASEILAAFRNTTDGQMDEVHQLRDLFNADVCVLVTHLGFSTAGIAYSSNSMVESSAFMAVTPGYLNSCFILKSN